MLANAAVGAVDVVMATFNGERYLHEQLASIAEQRGVSVRLTVFDDASQDSTLAILRRWSADIEIDLIPSPVRCGVPAAYCHALDHLRQPRGFIAFADQDDIWSPLKLHSAVSTLAAKETALWMTGAQLISEGGEPLSDGPMTLHVGRVGFGNALVQSAAPGCAMVFTRDLLPYLQQTDPRRIVMHDSWTYLCASAFGTLVVDAHPQISYRLHSSNVVGLRNSSRDRAKRVLKRVSTRQSPWASQARYLVERFGHLLTGWQAQPAGAMFHPGLRGVARRLSLASKGVLFPAWPSQQPLLFTSLMVPLASPRWSSSEF